jgi:hypothetical protein
MLSMFCFSLKLSLRDYKHFRSFAKDWNLLYCVFPQFHFRYFLSWLFNNTVFPLSFCTLRLEMSSQSTGTDGNHNFSLVSLYLIKVGSEHVM